MSLTESWKYFSLAMACPLILAACGNSDGADEKKEQASSTLSIADDIAKKLDIKTEVIEKKEISRNLHITGKIQPVVGQETDVNTRFSGRVVKVLVHPGEYVHPGQELALVDSAEISSLQSDLMESKSKLALAEAQASREGLIYQENLQRPQSLIEAQTNYDETKVQLDLAQSEYRRYEGMLKEKIAAEKDFLTAKAALESARLAHKQAATQLQREAGLFKNKAVLKRDYLMAQADAARERQHLNTLVQRLQFLGMSPAKVNEVMATNRIFATIPLLAKSAGVITSQELAIGEMIDQSDRAMTVTDLSKVLVSADLPEADISSVKIGDPVKVKVSSYPREYFDGIVSFISEHVDPETRTVAIRALLDNAQHKLKLNMFAEIDFQVAPRTVIACSKSAVQERDNKKVVFIKTADGYKEREVVVTPGSEQYYEVISGLNSGEEVVTQGSLLLKTELSSNR
ncbi:MAG: efflux RND transporter periplasmic adaptor subunit [Candidatus Obscuribacterales bacterium]|nr:efflux RND transporter periplasmic adaptor subunit [Candidatus Obscuribacterales bacterium]